MNTKVLVIDDEMHIVELLKFNLRCQITKLVIHMMDLMGL